ncbi:hypothetical protein GGX14DRAFT_427421, partial [Mycena pura]
ILDLMNSILDASSASDFVLISYVDVACLTLLTYDTLLSAGQEYKHIWKSQWGVIKVLYLWSRYGAFIDTTIAVQKRVGNVGPSYCRFATDFDTLFSGLGIGVTEIILMIRTYAQYNRAKKLLAFFFLSWFITGGVCLWVVIQWSKSFTMEASVPSLTSCNVESSAVGIACYAALLGGETVTVLLTLWKGIYFFFLPKSQQKHLHVMTTFYRDGIIFYLVMLFIFIAVAVLRFVAPMPLQDAGDTPLRVIHSISACHLVIRVREVAIQDSEDVTGGLITSGLNFGSPSAAASRSCRETH